MKDKIDIVYLWVDDTDENWCAEKNKWLQKITGRVPMARDSVATERFRDNGELMYSLRSIAECAPWVNHIYIVTGFGQVPKWLNTKNKRVSIVQDSAIMPAEALPTFNSASIEKCIANIPGLSEHFLLMNDDMFFNKHLSPLFFYDSRGRALYRFSSTHKFTPDELKTKSAYEQQIFMAQTAISNLSGKNMFKYSSSHGIDPYIKSSIQECLNEPTLRDNFKAQICNKFRTCDEYQRIIFNYYDYVMGRAVFQHARAKKYGRHKVLNAIYNLIHWFEIQKSNVYVSNVVGKEQVLLSAPTFCINDGPENDAKILARNREFLEKRFPNKSEFEK
jgi:hypothetical protein